MGFSFGNFKMPAMPDVGAIVDNIKSKVESSGLNDIKERAINSVDGAISGKLNSFTSDMKNQMTSSMDFSELEAAGVDTSEMKAQMEEGMDFDFDFDFSIRDIFGT